MRILLGVAAASFLFATPVTAQTEETTCGALPPAPTDQPDGATANRALMDAYTQRFNAWAEATNQVLHCKRSQAEAARARADALANEFNTENTALRAAIESWTAEITEFNARAPARRERN